MALFSECAGPTLGRWAPRRIPHSRNDRPKAEHSSAFCPSAARSRRARSGAPPGSHLAFWAWSSWACDGRGQPPVPPGRIVRAPERPSSGLPPGRRLFSPQARLRREHPRPLVGLQEDARMGQLLACRGAAAGDQDLQLGAVVPGQAHGVLPLRGHGNASLCSLPRGNPDEWWKQSRYPRRNVAANQSCQCTRRRVFSEVRWGADGPSAPLEGDVRRAMIRTLDRPDRRPVAPFSRRRRRWISPPRTTLVDLTPPATYDE
jgi:hypothetical protein